MLSSQRIARSASGFTLYLGVLFFVVGVFDLVFGPRDGRAPWQIGAGLAQIASSGFVIFSP